MEHILTLGFLATTVGATWRLATPIIFASIGEVVSERAGVLNIGLEGIMLIGAFAGFWTMYETGYLPLAFLAATLSGVAADLVCGVVTDAAGPLGLIDPGAVVALRHRVAAVA